MSDELLKKISGWRATVGIIGMGYVGLPLAVAFGRGGLRAIGFDVDGERVEKCRGGRCTADGG